MDVEIFIKTLEAISARYLNSPMILMGGFNLKQHDKLMIGLERRVQELGFKFLFSTSLTKK